MAYRVGQRLDNYRLTLLLGAGSFGEVYLAEHTYRKTQVAVKVLPQLADDDLPGFLNEARTIRLKHPHIVQILDFGVDNHIPFIVMEYISNGTLRQRYPKGSRLPLAMIVLYVKQVADALQYAHDEKLIHRDVKPENMLQGSNNEVLLSDFGIVTMAHSSGSRSIQEMAGTVAYMAPEQLQGKPVLASDQYALGVVVYEWLCGERPFKGSPMEIVTQHILAPIPSLRQKVPTIPPAVEQVVLRALEKEPKKRFANVRAFASALEQASRPESTRLVAPPPSVQPPTSPPLVPFIKEELSSNAVPLPSEPLNSPSPVTSVPASVQSLSNAAFHPYITDTARPQPILKEQGRKHRRIFYLVPIVLALLMVGTIGGGAYYLARANESQMVNQALATAQQLLTRAQSNVASDPALALKTLSTAQSTLRDVQRNHQLNETQIQRVIQLQAKLLIQVKAAISAYNQQAKIFVLPCSATSMHSINNTNTQTNSQAITWAQDPAKNLVLYTLAEDGVLYRVNSQYGLISSLSPLAPAKTPPHFLSLASNGSLLYLLEKQTSGNLYTLMVFQPGPMGVLSAPRSTAQIDANVTAGGYMPTLMTAWGNTIYVVLSSQSNVTNARFLSYFLDANGLLGAPKATNFSISAPVVSIAAFPTQLFLLLSSGEVRSLPLESGSQSLLPTPVLVQAPIALPLTTSGKEFTAKMDVPAVTHVEERGSTSLMVPSTLPSNPAMLAASLINRVPHLYIGDRMNHRILDLEVAQQRSNTPAPTPVGSTVTLQLEQQYVSPADLSLVKSLAVDPQGVQLGILSQNTPSMVSLVTVSTGPQTGCAS